jgi:acetyl-CoA carboxylase carboxyl transferase subunit alpha
MPMPLSRWEIVQLARLHERPTSSTLLPLIFDDFVELHGDRFAADDPALLAGPARLSGRPVIFVAHGRGQTEEEDRARNKGMTRPSGFRKAQRMVELAERLALPVIAFIDTPGAYPGADAEEHGQAYEIAATLQAFAKANVPIVSCVLGEGGSGGALALSVSDRLLMMENSVFEVISPEACSSILFRDGSHAEQVADSLHLTAPDLKAYGLIDESVPEPPGGAHRDPTEAASRLKCALVTALQRVSAMNDADRTRVRQERIRRYGTISG